jgi:hypothetical protein
MPEDSSYHVDWPDEEPTIPPPGQDERTAQVIRRLLSECTADDRQTPQVLANVVAYLNMSAENQVLLDALHRALRKAEK